MRPHAHADEQVARRRAAAAGPAAGRARARRDLASTATARAGTHERHRPLPDAHAALSLAFRTGGRAGRVRAAAGAGRAHFGALDGDLGRQPPQRVEQPDLELVLEILSAPRGRAAAAALAEDVAEQILEVGVAAEAGAGPAGAVARAAEARPRITPSRPAFRVLAIGARLLGVEAGLDAGHAEFVVQLALLRVAENVVRFGDGLEALLGV